MSAPALGRLSGRSAVGFLWVLIPIVAALIGWQWTRARNHGPAVIQHGPVPVVVAQVIERDLPQLLTAVGNVQALQNVTLRPQIDGVLRQVLVTEGQRVTRGQLLASIDDRAQSATLAQARAARQRDAANLKIGELDLQRDQNLLRGEAIARQAVDQQSALVEQLKATIQADEAAINAAEVQLSYTRILSPVTGRVGMRRVDAGNLVRATDTTGLFSVAQIDPISVVFSLPQQDLPRLQPLLADPARAQVVARDRGAGAILSTGHLMTVDNQIDATTGTLSMRAIFANPQGVLWHGQFVTVELRTNVEAGALVVPNRAIQQGTDGAYVFRVRDAKAEVVPVTVRYRQDDIAVLGKGLAANDVVVVDGQSQLLPGVAVRVISGDDARDHGSGGGGGGGIAAIAP
jgi:RND family efflux transporter MFP subunit